MCPYGEVHHRQPIELTSFEKSNFEFICWREQKTFRQPRRASRSARIDRLFATSETCMASLFPRERERLKDEANLCVRGVQSWCAA